MTRDELEGHMVASTPFVHGNKRWFITMVDLTQSSARRDQTIVALTLHSFERPRKLTRDGVVEESDPPTLKLTLPIDGIAFDGETLAFGLPSACGPLPQGRLPRHDA